MPYTFSFSDNYYYQYRPGSLYLGIDPERGYAVGIETERHAITIAGAGAGKGAALMIPNLLRWPHNALVIDPKGEAAEQTAAAREVMGQAIHVLDPFRVADVPDRFRAKLNPLSGFQRDAIDAREDIGVIADGLVMRTDPKSAHWDNGGLSVIAGLIAYLLDKAPPELCNLPEMRQLLTLPPDAFGELLVEMGQSHAFGNLPAAGAAKLTGSGTEAGHFRSTADENTKWLDSPTIGDLLSSNTFDISDLKTKPCTVYLVLPPHLMGEHGRFLRLFVRMALNAMAKGGVKGGRRCLFLLDEFYSLGRIDEIAKAAGLMRGYGVSLWPILQDLGQLESLYGRDGMHTFFGNSDAHIFFGNTDAISLDYVSARIGKISPDEIPAPPQKWSISLQDKAVAAMWAIDHENDMARYRHETAGLGGPRVPPDRVRQIVMKGQGNPVARSMIVFAKGSDILNVELAPYFLKPATRNPKEYEQPNDVELWWPTLKFAFFFTLAALLVLLIISVYKGY